MNLKFQWKQVGEAKNLYLNGIQMGYVWQTPVKASQHYVFHSYLPEVKMARFLMEKEAMAYAESATKGWFKDCLGGSEL